MYNIHLSPALGSTGYYSYFNDFPNNHLIIVCSFSYLLVYWESEESRTIFTRDPPLYRESSQLIKFFYISTEWYWAFLYWLCKTRCMLRFLTVVAERVSCFAHNEVYTGIHNTKCAQEHGSKVPRVHSFHVVSKLHNWALSNKGV